jgi:hypothetical protein
MLCSVVGDYPYLYHLHLQSSAAFNSEVGGDKFLWNNGDICKTTQQHEPEDHIWYFVHRLLNESGSYFDVEHTKSVSGIHSVKLSEIECKKFYGIVEL